MPNFGRMPATWPVYDDNGLTRLLLIIVQMPMLIHTCRMSSIDSRVIESVGLRMRKVFFSPFSPPKLMGGMGERKSRREGKKNFLYIIQ